jgi:hypothetical protein
MARIITKGLIGLEDVNLGTSTFTRATSTGGTQVLHQINAANLGTGFPLNTSSPVAPTGTINGSNAVFTLPTAPGPVVLIFRNGLLQQGGGIDYTLSGSTVTFSVAPLTGDTVLAVY